MIPMITVAGTRQTRRFNPLWQRAQSSSHWTQNPMLSFGHGAPVAVASHSAVVDAPPIQANPPPAPSPYEKCRAFCYDHPEIKNCISKNCAWLKDAEPPKPSMRPARRARHRMRASFRRRRGISVGQAHAHHHDPAWKQAGSCCASCFEGKPCQGGCGDKCTCGKEGKSKVRLNPMTVLTGDLAFSPPTTSRLLNGARTRLRHLFAR